MQIDITPVKTYKTEKTAIQAVEKIEATKSVRYFIMKSKDDRYFPVFIGESAIQAGLHFHIYQLVPFLISFNELVFIFLFLTYYVKGY